MRYILINNIIPLKFKVNFSKTKKRVASHLPAVRAPGQGVVEGVEEEGVVTVSTGDSAHSRHIGHWYWGWGRGGQIYNPLTVGSAGTSIEF